MRGDFFMSVLIMFRSLTYAQKGVRALERSGIGADLTKAPIETTDRGCTYCVRVTDQRMEAALSALDRQGIAHGRVMRSMADGGYREVGL